MGRKEPKIPVQEVASIPTSNKLIIQRGDQKKTNVSQDDKKGPKKVWRLCQFRNPARSDGLTLKHWRQVELRPENTMKRQDDSLPVKDKYEETLDSGLSSTLPRTNEEMAIVDSYTFAKVAPAVKIYRYSDEFYRYQIGDLDPSWTKEETDLLFDLCEMFELRFIAIHDRFKWRKDVSLERLKHRYYTVTKRIVEFSFEEKIKLEMAKHNNSNHPVVLALREESSRHPLVKYVYNMEHDRERRIMLDRSFKVTEKQKELENELLNEIKEAESLFKREERKKSNMRKLKRKFNVNEDAIPQPTMDKLHSKDVWLASDMVTNYKAQLNQKHNEAVDEMLAALNIPAPIVSSRASNELYCVVRGDAAIMINLVNKVESLRKELEHWKTTSGTLPEQATTPRSKDDKSSTIPEVTDFQTAYQTPRPIMTPKVVPKPKPIIPQQILSQSIIGPEEPTTPALEPVKPFPDQQQQSQQQGPQPPHMPQPSTPIQTNQEAANTNFMYQQQMARQRMMMAQQGQPQRPHMYPVKMAQTGASSPHSFQQQGHFGHMMPHQAQQMGNQQQQPQVGQHSPMTKQRPAMHQMPQQAIHHPHQMMQPRGVPPQRMMQYVPYSQQPFPPGFQQQFSPMPMRPHPQGVYYQNQMFQHQPQSHFGHMMQHPMGHSQGMHPMNQGHQMHHMHHQGHMQGQMSPQGQMQGALSGQMSPQGQVTPQGNIQTQIVQGHMPGHMTPQGNMQSGMTPQSNMQGGMTQRGQMQGEMPSSMQSHIQGQMPTGMQAMMGQQEQQGSMPQHPGMGNGQQMSPHHTRSI